jgi:hypothetical protein
MLNKELLDHHNSVSLTVRWSACGKVNFELGSVFKFQHERSEFTVHRTSAASDFFQVHWVYGVVCGQ